MQNKPLLFSTWLFRLLRYCQNVKKFLLLNLSCTAPIVMAGPPQTCWSKCLGKEMFWKYLNAYNSCVQITKWYCCLVTFIRCSLTICRSVNERSVGYGCVVTVPYILETVAGDSDLSFEQLLQLASTASATGVVTSRGKSDTQWTGWHLRLLTASSDSPLVHCCTLPMDSWMLAGVRELRALADSCPPAPREKCQRKFMSLAFPPYLVIPWSAETEKISTNVFQW